MDEGAAHGTRDVKKLSKERERAADQAHMKRTSMRVWASLLEVRQRPRGRPKYSRYMATMTWTRVSGANMITSVLCGQFVKFYGGNRTNTYGELPTAPIIPLCNSISRIRIATPRAAVVNVILMNRKSWEVTSQ